jgi:hypothetical protein
VADGKKKNLPRPWRYEIWSYTHIILLDNETLQQTVCWIDYCCGDNNYQTGVIIQLPIQQRYNHASLEFPCAVVGSLYATLSLASGRGTRHGDPSIQQLSSCTSSAAAGLSPSPPFGSLLSAAGLCVRRRLRGSARTAFVDASLGTSVRGSAPRLPRGCLHM